MNLYEELRDALRTEVQKHNLSGQNISIRCKALSAEEVLAIYNSQNQVTSVKKNDALLPNDFYIAQNYPNPFNPTTQINYSLGKNTRVELSVHNILGHNVATLVNGYQGGGNYSIVWDASKVSAGVYLYTMKADNFVVSKKMLLVK